MTEANLRFLSLKDVVAKTGLSAPSVRRLIKAGDFPEPFDLSPKRIAFWEHQVDEWMLARAARGRKPKDMPRPHREARDATK
jgi:prophage regulatory protein